MDPTALDVAIFLVMFGAAASLLRNRRREIAVDEFVQAGPGELRLRPDLKYRVNGRRASGALVELQKGDKVTISRMVKRARTRTALGVASVAVVGLALISAVLHARRPKTGVRRRARSTPGPEKTVPE